jgi:hypothetical protein
MPSSRKSLRVLLVLALLAAILAVPSTVNAGHTRSETTAKANLHAANQTGVKAHIHFTDDGDALWDVEGTATGMIPNHDGYVSLVHDARSVPGGPGNVARLGICEPTFEGEELGPLPGKEYPDISARMFVGFWSVDENGIGTLSETDVDLPGAGEWRTVSVRNVAIDSGMGPLAVAACGQVAIHNVPPSP